MGSENNGDIDRKMHSLRETNANHKKEEPKFVGEVKPSAFFPD